MTPDTSTTTPGTDPATRIPLFCSRRISPYTLRRIQKGTDLYVNAGENNETAFFLLHWTEEEHGSVERCGDSYTIPYSYSTVAISEECAIRLLRSLILMPDTMNGVEFSNILKYVPNYFRDRRTERSEARGGEDQKSSIVLERSLDVVYVLQDDSCGKYLEYFRQPPEIS